jgi:quaternary ammonium compound-resistance protein SugE
MVWLTLVVSGLFEVEWAIGLKYTYGVPRLGPSMATDIGMVLSFVFLTRALKTLPIGREYAVDGHRHRWDRTPGHQPLR